jgi:nitrogen regulatory protein PII
MKKVEATINPSELDAARAALFELGVNRISVCDVQAYYPLARRSWYRGSEYAAWFAPQIRIGIVVDDDRLAPCIAAICRCAGADAAGRSAIAVLPVEDAIQIRAGQHPARAA